MNAFNNSQLNLILLRPGSTDLDEQGRITGSLDIPLSEQGREQVKRLAMEITGITVDRIYSAPGSAARQTVQGFPQFKDVKVRYEESLSNINHGLWHGMQIAELQTNQPRLFKQWQENPDMVQPPGGESIEEVRRRIHRLFRQIQRKQKAGKVLLVAAEPVAGIILSELEGADLSSHWQTHGRFAEWTWVRCQNEALNVSR